MRLVEFASAADQLALWKLISDNVWSSINVQAKQQAQVAAQQKRIVKPKTRVASKAKIPTPPAPKLLTIAKPLYPEKSPVKKPQKARAGVTDKRLTVHPTVKTPNSNSAKKDVGVAPTGIAKMNTPLSGVPMPTTATENHSKGR